LTCLSDYRAKAAAIQNKYPFYKWACRNVKGYLTKGGNVAFREKCLKLAKNEAFAEELWIMCARDMLFWVNTFVYTFDPRLIPNSTVLPFITYDFQNVALDEIKESIEFGFDQLTEKSRDMGASWMYIGVYTWFFLFRYYQAFRMMSRTEDLVDKTEDPDSLFWKVMFIIDHLPKWMRPAYNRTHLHLKNLDNDSTIDGCSTTGDAARGGRCTSMLIDEFAAVEQGNEVLSSTRDVTKSRQFNSTHKGTATAFHRLSKGKIRKLRLHWSLHPVKSKGLYYSKDGKLVIIDKDFKGRVMLNGKEYTFPEEYPFRLDGKVRSPWYDNECDRAAHPMEIAQELDMDPFASDFQYFDPAVIEQIEANDIRPPFLVGNLVFDDDTLEPMDFLEDEKGPLSLWIYPDAYGHFPGDLEVIAGIDISAGTGASNSVASFVNLKTGEKIAEYANPWIKPEAFAGLAIALCKYFKDAFMVFDGAGPGRTFGDTVIELGYRNLYFRRNEEGLNKKVTDKPGVFLNPKEKAVVLGAYRKALKEGAFIQRSHIANRECLEYVYTMRNSIEHSSAVHAIDPSGAKDQHGDRVIADALANKGRALMGHGPIKKEKKTIPENCYAARRRRYEEQLKKEKEW